MKGQVLLILMIVSMLIIAECAPKRKPSTKFEENVSSLSEKEFKILYRDYMEKKNTATKFSEQKLWEKELQSLQDDYQAKFGHPLTV
jgi:hypothetical protein